MQMATAGVQVLSARTVREGAPSFPEVRELRVRVQHQPQQSNKRLDGAILADEALRDFCDSCGADISQIQDALCYAFDRFDRDGDGRLSLEEFLLATQMMGIKMSPDTAKTVFAAVAEGKEEFVPKALAATPAERLGWAMVSALERRSEQLGLSKAGTAAKDLWNMATEGGLSLEQRGRSLQRWLDVNQHILMELLGSSVDIVGLGLAFTTLTQMLSQKLSGMDASEIDATDSLPLMILVYKIFRDASREIDDISESNLSHDKAIVHAMFFKPAGFSLSNFQELCDQGSLQWIRLLRGATLSDSDVSGIIGFVVRGKMRVECPSLVPGLYEVSNVLAPGSLFGDAKQLLKRGFHGEVDEADGNRRFVVEEEALVMTLCRTKVKRYLKTRKDGQVKFQSVIARCITRNTSNVSDHVSKTASEFPVLCREVLLTLTSIVQSDRATLWIHDPEKAEFWTLFLFEDGDLGNSKYVSIPDSAGLTGYAFSHKEVVNVPDCYLDDRFNQEIDKKTGYRTKSVLCLPIQALKPGEQDAPLAVLQLLNRKAPCPGGGHRHVAFSEDDVARAQENLWLLRLIAVRLRHRYAGALSRDAPDAGD